MPNATTRGVDRIAQAGTGALSQTGNIVQLFVDVARQTFVRPFQWREFIQQAWFIASVTILPTALIAIPFGAIVSLQTGSLIKQLGAEPYTGAASVLVVIQQGSPLVTSLLLAGAVGSAIAADLGSRTIRDEIDAMRVMGVNPIQRLISPRLLATMVVSFLLCGFVCFVGFITGYVFNVYFQGGTPGSYTGTFASFATTADLMFALAKAVIFGAIVAIVACDRGLSTKGGPAGVANSVNAAVVNSVLLLFTVNVVLTQVFAAGGLITWNRRRRARDTSS